MKGYLDIPSTMLPEQLLLCMPTELNADVLEEDPGAAPTRAASQSLGSSGRCEGNGDKRLPALDDHG